MIKIGFIHHVLLFITVHPVSPCSDPGGGGEIAQNQLFENQGFHKNVIAIKLISQKSDNLSMGNPGFNLKWILILFFLIAMVEYIPLFSP